MPVVQQKTDVRAHVQIHSEYRQIIDAVRPDGKVVILHEDTVEPPPLHLREDGVRWTQAGFETAWQRQMTCEAGEDASVEERENRSRHEAFAGASDCVPRAT